MYAIITKDSNKAVEILRQGRVVAFPTNTSYGLAVDALQGHALQRLRNLKRRPQNKSFTVFLKQTLWDTYLNLTDQEQTLLEKIAGQPLTLLIKPRDSLAHLAQDGYIGLRVIDHPLMRELAEAVDVPLTATSANISGREPCLTPVCIHEQFPGKLDETTYDLSLGAILDAGPLPGTSPTTLAKLVDNKIEIIRAGELTRAAIKSILTRA